MTGGPLAIPPQEHAFIAYTLDRKPLIRHGVAEIAMRWNGSATLDEESGQKKVSKEIARERQKEAKMDAQRMIETTDAVMGGYGYWYSEANSLREAIGREKHRRLTSFLKFQQTLERTYVPELKQEIRQKMLDKFGTTDYRTHKANVLNLAVADPQMDVLASRGQVIKTTLTGIQEYASERNAAAMSDYQK